MVIYTPNTIPKSFRNKWRMIIPSIKFALPPKDFFVFKDVPSVDTSRTPHRIVYTRVYSGKSFLQINYHLEAGSRERSGSGYTGEYTEYFTRDGIKLLLCFGSQEKSIQTIKMHHDKPIGGEWKNSIRGYKYNNLYGSECVPRSDLRDDLENEKVQEFVMGMLKDSWGQVLQSELL